MIGLIVAMDQNRGIGRDGGLLWLAHEDLKRFKKQTMGKKILYGRKTLLTFPKAKPLSGRENWLLSRSFDPAEQDFDAKTLIEQRELRIFKDTDQLDRTLITFRANALSEGDWKRLSEVDEVPEAELMIIGGASIYERYLSYADYLDVTRFDGDGAADCFFPSFEEAFELIATGEKIQEEGVPTYRYLRYLRKDLLP